MALPDKNTAELTTDPIGIPPSLMPCSALFNASPKQYLSMSDKVFDVGAASAWMSAGTTAAMTMMCGRWCIRTWRKKLSDYRAPQRWRANILPRDRQNGVPMQIYRLIA